MVENKSIYSWLQPLSFIVTALTFTFGIYQFIKHEDNVQASEERMALLEERKIRLADSLSRDFFLVEKKLEFYIQLEDAIGSISVHEERDKAFIVAVQQFDKLYYSISKLYLSDFHMHQMTELHGTINQYRAGAIPKVQLVKTADLFGNQIAILAKELKIIENE